MRFFHGLLLLSLGWGTPCLSAEIPLLEFVLDMDNMLVFRDIQKNEALAAQTPKPYAVEADGELYRITWGAPELIQFLVTLPQRYPEIGKVRLHFCSAYSGNDPVARMEKLLDHLVLPDGTTARSHATNLIYYQDLLKPEFDVAAAWRELPFSLGRYESRFLQEQLRKSIAKHLGDVRHAILIDDNPGWVLPAEFHNLLYVRNRTRNAEMARVAGLVDAAVASALIGDIYPSEFLYGFQWEVVDGVLNYRVQADALDWVRRGETLLQSTRENFSVLSAPFEEADCGSALEGRS